MGTRIAALQDKFVNYTITMIKQGILNYEFNNLLLQQNDTNPGFVANKLQEFFQSLQQQLDNLAQILEKGNADFPNLDRILLGLKDSCSTIGAERFVSECVEFRINSHAKDKQGCLRCLERTRQSYNKLKTNIETLLGMENRIVQDGGIIPNKLPINEKTGTKVAQYQFEYVDYTSTLMDEHILIKESDPKYQAQNLNVAFREATRKLDNLATFFYVLSENMIFDFNIEKEILSTMRFIMSKLDSSSIGAVGIIPLRSALKDVRDYYKERNMERFMESMNKAKDELNLLETRLKPIVEMEKKIVDGGGSIPKPIVRDTRRIGALHSSNLFIIGVDSSWNVSWNSLFI